MKEYLIAAAFVAVLGGCASTSTNDARDLAVRAATPPAMLHTYSHADLNRAIISAGYTPIALPSYSQ